MNHRKSTVFLLFCAGKARTSYLKETIMYQFESGTNNIKFSFLERPDEFVNCHPTQTIQQQTQSNIFYFLLYFLSLVPKRSLFPTFPREVWEKSGRENAFSASPSR